jgi:prepilin-type N-terminal cleavage/methylation domain-containing protein
MKNSRLFPLRGTSRGFTLMELMAVVAIMATLAALTMVGFRHAQTTAARNRTAAFHRAIISGLEQYNNDFGEFPTPRNPQAVGNFSGREIVSGGASMLYQALSGDGNDQIVLGTAGATQSDGEVSASEVQFVKITDMPRELVMQSGNTWVLADGFNRPFQYTKGPDKPRPGEQPPNPTTMNPTYDLWSFAESENFPSNVDLSQKRDPKLSAKWIKNW